MMGFPRTEVLGLSLTAFSVVLPYIGQFFKGATRVLQANILEGVVQIFPMSPNISNTVKEDLAWGSYTLLRNTNSISVKKSERREKMVLGSGICAREVVMDARHHMLGRLSSILAKEVLNG
ncbi:Protein of unknown function DUF2930 [Cynara cardunculus var. scolymus]|uniref:Uncharacterized protein n=1 Tax=Cynara cardunculus var. scolymus TaxID=59895 RepID=A0A103L7K6_CYNCS|nr:Protein of unknown function DUF2930 [Cynara cardunculus var. scolymus]